MNVFLPALDASFPKYTASIAGGLNQALPSPMGRHAPNVSAPNISARNALNQTMTCKRQMFTSYLWLPVGSLPGRSDAIGSKASNSSAGPYELCNLTCIFRPYLMIHYVYPQM